jgi:heat shock protein HslJ
VPIALFHAPGAILVAILAAAPAQTGTTERLAGTAWRAVELAGTPVPAPPSPEREPHLVFGTDGRVSGADGCNRLTGPYTEKGDAVSFGNLAGTMMACPGSDEIARRFRSALKGTAHWRVENGRLTFYGATGQPLAVFERREAAPAPGAPALAGTAEPVTPPKP